MDERIIRATLQWGQDAKSLEALKSSANGVKNALKQVDEQAQKTRQRMNEIRESAERLNMVSQRIAMIGAAVGGPLLLAANKYVSTAKDAESTSREWLAATKEIEQAQVDIGRVVAREVLPLLKQGADLLSQAADFAEKNPGTVEAVLKFAAIATAVGTVGSVISGIVGTIATLGGVLSGLSGAITAVKTAAFVATGESLIALGLAVPAIIAAAGTAAAADVTKKSVGAPIIAGQLGSGVDLLGIGATMKSARGLSGGVSPDERQAIVDARAATNALTGYMADFAEGAKIAAEGIKQAAEEQKTFDRGLEMFVAYRKQETEAQAQFEERRQQLIDEGNAAALQAQLDYTAQRGKIITDFGVQQAKEAKDFAKNEQQTEDAYYAARLKSARNFGEETLRAEEDHQREMRYAAEDYQDQVTELAGQNDAYGLVKAARAYEKERRRKEEEYQTETARKNKDYAQSLADEEEAFQKERDQRLQAFQERQRDAEADNRARLQEFDDNFNAEKEKRKTQNQARLDDLKAQFDKEQKKRADDFKDRLTALDDHLTGETEVRRKFYELSAKDFKAYLQAIVTGKPYKPSSEFESFLTGNATTTTTTSGGGGPQLFQPQAAGGYAYGPGLYLRGEAGREWTMDNATTRAAEAALGGPISSAALVAALRRGPAGGGLSISLGGISIMGGSPESMARQVLDKLYTELVPVFQRAAAV